MRNLKAYPEIHMEGFMSIEKEVTMFDDYPESKYAIRDKDIPKIYKVKFILILLIWIGLDVLIVVYKSYLPLWLAGMSIVLFIPISIMCIFLFLDPKTGKFTINSY